ncbi:MAG: 3-oxoacyl-[acyl-carrier-protein] synthase III C-terminal domain-containing protein [Rhabdochlamydiaceae bacterium]|jgi:3-oxoacyl-[acyl-carrier-protein] synthase-3
MSKLPVKILGTGVHLPSKLVTSDELEKQLGYPAGTFEKSSGVRNRYHATDENSSDMGMMAAERALKAANMDKSELDAIVCVSGVPQQSLPTTAAIIHRKMGLKSITAFDINSTCLSFLTGLFVMSHLITQGVYRNVLLVSSEIASVGLNPKDPKTASLFGDGAAAAIIGPSETGGIIASHFETRSEYGESCQCEGGGTLLALKDHIPRERHYFQMNGPRLFKAAMPPVLKMIRSLKEKSDRGIDLYIPHQASPLAVDTLQKKLGAPDSQFINIVRDYGNMIAVSIPFALHMAIEDGRLQRGNRALLLGTGAGLTIGGVLLEY